MDHSTLDSSLATSAERIDFQRIVDAPARRRITICGMVVRIRTKPVDSLPSYEIAIEDPSGIAYARWMGRESLAGVGLGRRLLIEGVGAPSPRGLVFINPAYRLLTSF